MTYLLNNKHAIENIWLKLKKKRSVLTNTIVLVPARDALLEVGGVELLIVLALEVPIVALVVVDESRCLHWSDC